MLFIAHSLYTGDYIMMSSPRLASGCVLKTMCETNQYGGRISPFLYRWGGGGMDGVGGGRRFSNKV